jgi:hypothetical protein
VSQQQTISFGRWNKWIEEFDERPGTPALSHLPLAPPTHLLQALYRPTRLPLALLPEIGEMKFSLRTLLLVMLLAGPICGLRGCQLNFATALKFPPRNSKKSPAAENGKKQKWKN